MSKYTGNGDRGLTELIRTKNVSKADERIALLGTIEELSSHLGVIQTLAVEAATGEFLHKIQQWLKIISNGVSDPYSKEGHLKEEAAMELEQEIFRLEGLFSYPAQEPLPGENPASAQMDLSRSVARRAERALAAVSVKFGSDTGAKKFMNRLSDYLYTLARFTDASAKAEKEQKNAAEKKACAEETQTSQIQIRDGESMDPAGTEKIVREVLRAMGIQGRITLDIAKRLIEEIEKEAVRRGKKAVIAVCSPEGNPIAVHVMDGAFLVSFDVAVKKAYTAVAVKMSTMELNALAQPGGTFYGLDKMEGGNIIIFGGGIPLKVGDTIIGGLGVSGGTGEEDHALAEYGVSVLEQIM